MEDKYGDIFHKITIVQPVMRKVKVTSKLPFERTQRMGNYGRYGQKYD